MLFIGKKLKIKCVCVFSVDKFNLFVCACVRMHVFICILTKIEYKPKTDIIQGRKIIYKYALDE